MQSTCCQTQNAKNSLHGIAGLLHFTGLAQWLATDSHICHGFGWKTQSPWITAFPRVSCLVSFLRRDRKRRGRLKKNRQEGKNNFLLKSRVTLCWWTCGAHQDEKELPQLWNPPVKINILFKPLSGKGRGEMRESKREREREGARRKRKRHRCGGVGRGGAASFGLDR